MSRPRLEAEALPGLPEIEPGTDLALEICSAADRAGLSLASGDVLIVAQKVVSKAEGRLVSLDGVRPSVRARQLAQKLDRDPRLVQLVLDESTTVVKAERGVLITRTRSGYVCANAGVDTSNVPTGMASLLPEDPDAAAGSLRAKLRQRVGVSMAIVISDSFGRPWRLGQTDVAIGCAGLVALDDLRGSLDASGRPLRATLPAVADEVASAAGLTRAKAGREAVVIVRGLDRYVTEADGPGARAIMRPREDDLFS